MVWPQIQFENYQCGVWACWASSVFLDQLRIGAPLITTPFQKYVRLDGETNVDSQLFNTSFITEVREHYTTLLERARDDNELIYSKPVVKLRFQSLESPL